MNSAQAASSRRPSVALRVGSHPNLPLPPAEVTRFEPVYSQIGRSGGHWRDWTGLMVSELAECQPSR